MEEKFLALGKYNFWNGNVPALGFPRKDYTDKIYNYTGNKLVKVLVGQRRTGKSYILRQIAQAGAHRTWNCEEPDITSMQELLVTKRWTLWQKRVTG